ncbi:group 10 secretory phospholipase A2 isoform X1 [Hemicordylus capensis]|uniref:group 10 secretory phospholipase A2 isoform X1 n=1 Tax=Hemicordylus capensis TaxID=884348 RepID=UPI002302D6E9|nr:group 10 secretory phospholipase A2 isoform X1 [Hemicordylus capensis]
MTPSCKGGRRPQPLPPPACPTCSCSWRVGLAGAPRRDGRTDQGALRRALHFAAAAADGPGGAVAGTAASPAPTPDGCCFEHDCCYEEAEKAGCAPKTQCYTWECEGNAAKCEHIEDQCQKKACECDRKAAKCLAKAPYDVKNIFWPDALCGKDSPKCKDDD